MKTPVVTGDDFGMSQALREKEIRLAGFAELQTWV
jgi:hypothetical protein